jgi:aarF domain-containing kinase
MRGAALKLGQMLSTMEEGTVPPLIQNALERARAQADFLPDNQLEGALRQAYGKDWRDLFISFNMNPIAAASIGQVHEAVLKESNEKVAIKIQYPGIAECVDQDVSNFKRIIKCICLVVKVSGWFIS